MEYACILQAMETREQLHHRVRHEQQLKARLRVATTRLTAAEPERIWAIVAAPRAAPRRASGSAMSCALPTGCTTAAPG